MSLTDVTNAMLELVRQHANWAAFIVFALAFGESLAFVSLILPFWGLLIGVGAVIGAADLLIFWTIVVAATVGAALGDWLSYWLGCHYQEQIRTIWPLKDHPKLMERGHAFFERWGVWAIVLGRFSGRCGPACRSWPSWRKCPGSCFRSQTGARLFYGRSCCSHRVHGHEVVA